MLSISRGTALPPFFTDYERTRLYASCGHSRGGLLRRLLKWMIQSHDR